MIQRDAIELLLKQEGKKMTVQEMRKAGYPLKIIGNGGYKATLVSFQPLGYGEYMGIYRYPGGDCCHDLAEIKRYFEIVEQ